MLIAQVRKRSDDHRYVTIPKENENLSENDYVRVEKVE